MSDRNVGQWL